MISLDNRGLNYVTETLTRMVYQRVLRPGDHALDIGANHGVHTAIMAQCVSELGVVHAFEPNPDLLPNLYSIPRVRVWPLAASNVLGAVSFYIPEGLDGWASQRDLTRDLPNHRIHEITTLRAPVDVLLREIKAHRVRFMKIDVEQHEEEAIRGMKELLERSRAVIVFESPTPEIEAIFSCIGYDVVSFDGSPWAKAALPLPNVVAIPREKLALWSHILPSSDEISSTIKEALAPSATPPQTATNSRFSAIRFWGRNSKLISVAQ